MRIAIVCQRYGANIVGGAEAQAREYAIKCSKDLQWKVDVYTTQAENYETWQNEFTAEKEFEHGITIFRFPVKYPRNFKKFNAFKKLTNRILKQWNSHRFVYKLLKGPKLESLWYTLQGPYCPTLIDHLEKNHHEYDGVIFFTYLYYPTVVGAKICPNTVKILIPESHDEDPFYFKSTRQVFNAVDGILTNTLAEKKLVDTVHSPKCPVKIGGMGVEPTSESPDRIFDKPYVLYLGRIGKSKASDELCHFFDFANLHPKLNLVLAGVLDVNFKIPSHQNIHYLGQVSESDKASLLYHCQALINPSYHESLSIIVLESIAYKKPVLVNGHCQVLLDYSLECSTVYAYRSSVEFASILASSTHDQYQSTHQKELQLSKNWLDERYSWTHILNELQSLLVTSKMKNTKNS